MNENILVDLDKTLAEYDYWRGHTHIGRPIPLMLARVKLWLEQGIDVRIFTARVSDTDPQRIIEIRKGIEDWCLENVGVMLPIVNCKDFGTIEIWDDRAIQLIPNTGIEVK